MEFFHKFINIMSTYISSETKVKFSPWLDEILRVWMEWKDLQDSVASQTDNYAVFSCSIAKKIKENKQ